MLTKEDIQNQKNQDKLVPFIPDGDFYFTKGVEAYQKRKFDIAIKWLKKAVEASPDEPVYQCQMSVVYTEVGAYHAANQLLTEVLSNHGEEYIDCYYLIANNYAHLGLLQDAKKYIKLYLEKAPNGDFEEEAKKLLEVLDLDDEDEDIDEWAFAEEDELLIYQETAFYHIERMEWELALPVIEEMMTLFPEYTIAKHEHSFVLFFSGQQDKAIESELSRLTDDPQSLFGHTNLAIFYYEQKQWKKCELHINLIKNVYPIHEQQKLRIANTLAYTGNYEEAYQRFHSLSKTQLNGHASYFKWFSISSYYVGDVSQAKLIWQHGCKRHPILEKETPPWLHE